MKGGKDELSLLLKKDTKDIENSIIAYILKLKKEGNSYSTLNSFVSNIIYIFSPVQFTMVLEEADKIDKITERMTVLKNWVFVLWIRS